MLVSFWKTWMSRRIISRLLTPLGIETLRRWFFAISSSEAATLSVMKGAVWGIVKKQAFLLSYFLCTNLYKIHVGDCREEMNLCIPESKKLDPQVRPLHRNIVGWSPPFNVVMQCAVTDGIEPLYQGDAILRDEVVRDNWSRKTWMKYLLSVPKLDVIENRERERRSASRGFAGTGDVGYKNAGQNGTVPRTPPILPSIDILGEIFEGRELLEALYAPGLVPGHHFDRLLDCRPRSVGRDLLVGNHLVEGTVLWVCLRLRVLPELYGKHDD